MRGSQRGNTESEKGEHKKPERELCSPSQQTTGPT
jgi:hypothetical protein